MVAAGSVRAKFVPVKGPGYEWVTSLIEVALNAPAGKPLIGISIDGEGATEPGEVDGQKCNVVREITQLGSADIVTRAGAGGQFHRRLSEAAASATARATSDLALTARRCSSACSRRWGRSRVGSSARTSERPRTRSAELHEAARAAIADPEAERLQARLREAEGRAEGADRRAREAEARAELADRATLARRLLLEVDVPGDVRESWFDDLIDKSDEQAMRAVLERRKAERRGQLAELRESLGLDRIEGAGLRRRHVPPRHRALACWTAWA